jgi:hypothetical protein
MSPTVTDGPVEGIQEVWGTAVTLRDPKLTSVRVSPDGRRVVYRTAARATGETESLQGWIVGPEPRGLAHLGNDRAISAMAEALDAALVIDGQENLVMVEVSGDPDAPIRTRWTSSGRCYRAASLDPPGRRVAALGVDYKTYLIDARTGAEEGRLDGTNAAFDATGERVALVTSQDRVQVRDAATRRPLASFRPDDRPEALYFSADGRHLVTVHGVDALTFRAWDTGTGAPRPHLIPQVSRTGRSEDGPGTWPLRQPEGNLAVETRGRQAWVCYRKGGTAPQPLPGAAYVCWGSAGPYLAVVHQDGHLAVYGPPLL